MVPVGPQQARCVAVRQTNLCQHPYQNHNLNINHIGISVDSIDKAADWYGKHFGFRRIRSDRTTDAATKSKDQSIVRIYGNNLNKVKVCWLVTGNGVGFELFEFIDPPVKSAEELKRDFKLEDQYRRGGVFHVGFTTPDPEGVAKRAREDGAVQVGETAHMVDGESALYLRDPWGMVIEVLSCSYEQLLGNRG